MGEDGVMSQSQAWKEYDRWFVDERIGFLEEPQGLERQFRLFSNSDHPSRRDWADAYLAAFAVSAEACLVTFDRGFRERLANVKILEA